MSDQILCWIAFNIFVLGMPAVDLIVYHRKAHAFNAKLKNYELYLIGIASKFRDKGIACKMTVSQH